MKAMAILFMLISWLHLTANLVNGDKPGVAQLTASPQVLLNNMDNVTLSWTGVLQPLPEDLIYIYSPYTKNASEPAIGWKYVKEVSTWETGSGSFTFPLVNSRENGYVFRYVSNGSVVATSNRVTFQNPMEPLQGHLALTSRCSEMRVMWVTGYSSNNPAFVEWGLLSANLTFSAAATTSSYSASDLCDSPGNSSGWLSPGLIHDAIMSNLTSQTAYFYRYGNDQDGWSSTFRFVSPPCAADTEVNFVIFGDLGVQTPFTIELDSQPPSSATMKYIAREMAKEPNGNWMTVHIGDISYARGRAFLWDWFHQLIQPVASAAPYMVCIGNHEYDYPKQPWKPSWSTYGTDSGGECGVPYASRFHMPASSGSSGNLWYSFDYGPVHFLLMSTEHDFLEGSEQWNFLKQDLKAVDRSKTPWIVFAGHRPMYTSSNYTSERMQREHLQSSIEPLLVAYQVDIAYWGHVHVYERTCGMVNFTCASSDNDAPVHMVVGSAGNTFQVLWMPTYLPAPGGATNDNRHRVQPAWSIFRTAEYGFSRMKANSSHFHLQFIGDQRGRIHDELWLTKQSN